MPENRAIIGMCIAYGALYAAVYGALHVGLSSRASDVPWISVPLALALILGSAIDHISCRLPNWLTIPMIGGGLGFTLWNAPDQFLWHSGAAMGGALLFVGANIAYEAIRSRRGLGMGDAKLYAAAGAWLGVAGLPAVLLWACATALASVIARGLLGRKWSHDHAIPFGPHVAMGIWLVWLFGPLV